MAKRFTKKLETPGTPAKVTTPVRNTVIPRTVTPATARPAAKKEITHEMIAKRAYEIASSGKGGSELEHWLQAERELKGQLRPN